MRVSVAGLENEGGADGSRFRVTQYGLTCRVISRQPERLLFPNDVGCHRSYLVRRHVLTTAGGRQRTGLTKPSASDFRGQTEWPGEPKVAGPPILNDQAASPEDSRGGQGRPSSKTTPTPGHLIPGNETRPAVGTGTISPP